MLLLGLLVEVARQVGQRFGIEVRRDGRILNARRKLVSDLLIDLVVQSWEISITSVLPGSSKVKPGSGQAAVLWQRIVRPGA
jgi:hypothetical protein